MGTNVGAASVGVRVGVEVGVDVGVGVDANVGTAGVGACVGKPVVVARRASNVILASGVTVGVFVGGRGISDIG